MSRVLMYALLLAMPYFGLHAKSGPFQAATPNKCAPADKPAPASRDPAPKDDDGDDETPVDDDDTDDESEQEENGNTDNQESDDQDDEEEDNTALVPFFDKASPSAHKGSFRSEGMSSIEGVSAAELEEPPVQPKKKVSIDLGAVFFASPYVYSLLFGISIFSVAIFAYTLMNLRAHVKSDEGILQTLRTRLMRKEFDELHSFCKEKEGLLFSMLSTALSCRKEGSQAMREQMRSEGRRATMSYWQRISLLNEMAIVAPMVGLLGTVLGMFYAFYDLNRSRESMSTLFDGLGISVGTTVAGLVVAILSMGLHLMMKHRLVRSLTSVEQEAQSLVSLMQEGQK